ncbi:MAG: cell division protein FtsW [Gammaproteobacteria bacterium]|nr:cell division protein FtsW [Gammaproteobacteria bacterium]
MTRHPAFGYNQASRIRKQPVYYDTWLITVILFLIGLGLVLVSSSSISVAEKAHGEQLFFFWRQLVAVSIGLVCALVTIRIPLIVWQRLNMYLLLLGILLLVLVLIPGVGKEVNGSMRWVKLGSYSLQSSELVRIIMIIYLAGYLLRHGEKLRQSLAGFIVPVSVVTTLAALLLLEPDFGTAVVYFAAALGMLFVGGVPLSRFVAWVMVAGMALVTLALGSAYRLQRLVSFMDPWSDPDNTGFQLIQALVAFGRGEWLGVGLGSSVQKLFYLPEAHTDFIFAVLAEELGLLGSVTVILLFFFIVWRSFVIAQVAEELDKKFAAYLAYGIGLMIGMQAFINMGVNMGLLPTKGLTLPFVSYGGNSVISNCILIGLLLRIEYENHFTGTARLPEVVNTYAA